MRTKALVLSLILPIALAWIPSSASAQRRYSADWCTRYVYGGCSYDNDYAREARTLAARVRSEALRAASRARAEASRAASRARAEARAFSTRDRSFERAREMRERTQRRADEMRDRIRDRARVRIQDRDRFYRRW